MNLELLSSLPQIDKAGALERVDGDEELYNEIVALYIEDTPKQIAILLEALKSKDKVVSERQAHSIKSASANIGADRISKIALEMEKIAKAGDLEKVKSLFILLEKEFSQIKSYFEQV